MGEVRIQAVCGFGCGSSLFLRIKIDGILAKHGLQARTFCGDVGTACSADCDVIFISEELSERVIEMCNLYKKKVYVIVANMSVILARRDLMYKTSCIILNEIEAGRLFDVNLQHLTPEQMLACAKQLAEKAGIRQMVITMGSNGCVYMDFDRRVFGHCPPIPTVVQDTTGAGDAFFSATVTALSNGKKLEDAVKYGTKLASLTLSTPESVCPRLGKEFFG